VDNNNGGRTGRECLIVCLWGYASYLNDRSALAHHDRGRIHPTTIVSGFASEAPLGEAYTTEGLSQESQNSLNERYKPLVLENLGSKG
jgi:hypothetical protein